VDKFGLSMPGASDEYQTARERLRMAELALRDQSESVATMRRALPPGPAMPEYTFHDGDKRVRLIDLFAPGKDELFMYHMMYWADDDEFCPMCSAWIDGLDAVSRHIEQRANIVVATLASVDKLQAWAKLRGWRYARLLSDDGGGFSHDAHAENAGGDPMSTVLVFVKDGATVRHVYTGHAELDDGVRGIDALNPIWAVLDLLPSGRGDWNCGNSYIP
jgi:predicted dithiol-disulfide oxidoreductase (DUF899 family)